MSWCWSTKKKWSWSVRIERRSFNVAKTAECSLEAAQWQLSHRKGRQCQMYKQWKDLKCRLKCNCWKNSPVSRKFYWLFTRQCHNRKLSVLYVEMCESNVEVEAVDGCGCDERPSVKHVWLSSRRAEFVSHQICVFTKHNQDTFPILTKCCCVIIIMLYPYLICHNHNLTSTIL